MQCLAKKLMQWVNPQALSLPEFIAISTMMMEEEQAECFVGKVGCCGQGHTTMINQASRTLYMLYVQCCKIRRLFPDWSWRWYCWGIVSDHSSHWHCIKAWLEIMALPTFQLLLAYLKGTLQRWKRSGETTLHQDCNINALFILCVCIQDFGNVVPALLDQATPLQWTRGYQWYIQMVKILV